MGPGLKIREYWLAVLALALTCGINPALAQAPLLRVASINMCTDQMLIDLARPEEIVGVGPFARDGVRSWASERIGNLPILSGTAEEILVLRPDFVVSSRFMKRATREFIKARSIRVEEFEIANDVAAAKRQILRMASLVNAPEKGAARANEIDRALANLREVASQRQLRVLPLSRRGWVSGRESLMSDLLRSAGLINVAGEAGLRAGGFMTLEAIVKLRPDALLISREDSRAEDQGRALLLHPAIVALFPPERRIVMPESLTVCGGPMLAEAMNRLARQLKGLKARDAAGG
ncbi:MAG: ABC transporter substrate-binding protein [Bosea sp. (in: a-proteobacteria)]